ncbi:MAG: GNAT family N-acetyltransferase [Oscillospiraceae bacterium]|nr:GNAT family N-acetyltransferase [Oscillospiraceae bacterium]
MIFPSKTVTLKDGRTALLREPRLEDAAEMLDYLKTTTSETHFLLRAPEECTQTIQQEADFLQSIIDDPNAMMIVCEVAGRIAGNCQITFKTKLRNRHRAMIGIGLLREFWNLGIGTALLRELITAAENRGGIMQVELEVIEGNTRAMALYEKMGFSTVAAKPNAIRLPDGTLLKEYYMVRPI